MTNLVNWINEKIKYKEELNEKYRELSERGEPLYDGRILFGSGYIEAMEKVLEFLNKEENHALSLD